VIYVNGDSHSAGAEIVNDFVFAQDDPCFLTYGRKAHPEAILQTYGYIIAQAVGQSFFCDAESGSSNDRIIRTTKDFIKNARKKRNIHIIIGWSTWEREEWKLTDTEYVQVTSSGTDSVPESMEEEYKEWVLKQTLKELYRKTALWHDKIYDFHMELRDMKIKHTFFNTYMYFDEMCVPKEKQKDWHHQFINPYDQDYTFFYYLKNKGFETVNKNSFHYGINGHQEYTKVVLENFLAQNKYNKSPNYLRTNCPMLDEKPKVDKILNF